jgi:hypothetical protein
MVPPAERDLTDKRNDFLFFLKKESYEIQIRHPQARTRVRKGLGSALEARQDI